MYRGPNYWKKDSMVQDCKHLLQLFKATWPIMRTWIKERKGDYPSVALDEAALGTHLSDEAWKRFKNDLYDVENGLPRMRMLYEIDEYLKDTESTLTTCTDSDVRDAMIKLCSKNQANSIKKKVSCARQAFFTIGRKHEFSDGSKIQECTTAPVWAYTGCPVTSALQETLIERVSLEKEDKQSLGGAAEFPLMAWYNIEQLCRSCNLIERYENRAKSRNQQVHQIQNSCGLGMLILTLMHTGSRPGNVNRLLHEHLYFKGLHKKVYWLTLSVIENETLAHVIKTDVIKDYIMKIHNGYKKKGKEGRDELRVWDKSTIPVGYNSLDLPLMYGIYMRLILSVDPKYIKSPKVFIKESQTYSDIFGNQNKVLGLKDLVLYSMRYGTTKDEDENDVAEEVTRKRMAHSMSSHTAKDVYVKCTKKVKYADDETANTVRSPRPNLKNPLSDNNEDNMVYQRSWLEKSFSSDKMRKDFDESADLVSEYIETQSESSYNRIISRISGRKLSDLKKIPFGMSYMLPIGKDMLKKHELNKDTLSEIFLVCDKADHIPHLCDFTSLLYGNWRDFEKPDPIEEREEPVNEKTVVEKTVVEEPVPEPVPVVKKLVPEPVKKQDVKKPAKNQVVEKPVKKPVVEKLSSRIRKPTMKGAVYAKEKK